MRRFDVVIVGAGLAGLQCARLLAQKSFSVLLVDRKTDLTRHIHTTGIFVRRTLEDFDIAPRFLGPGIRHVAIHSPAGRRQMLESPRVEFRVGRMGALYAHMLEAAESAGAESLTGAHFRGVEIHDNALVITLEVDSSQLQIRSRYLVGADGASSKVAAALDLSRTTRSIVGVEEILQGVPLEGPPALHCYLDPVLAPGYIGWVAHDGEETHVGVGGYARSFSPARSLTRFRQRIAADFDLTGAELSERRGGGIPVEGILPRISCRWGLLIGDAAGAVSPLTAGGLDGAMRLSRYAAEVLAAAIEEGDRDLLSLYGSSGISTRFFVRRLKRKLLASVHSSRLIEAGCSLLRTPPLSALAENLFFGRGSFPEPDRTALRLARSARNHPVDTTHTSAVTS